MLRLPEFELRNPDTVLEAIETLANHGDDAMAFAGGTDVFPKMKRRQFTPDILVNLDGLDLEGIEREENGLVIGGRTSLATVSNHETVNREYPAIADAVGSVATPHHRRMGTIAGNLCQDTRCYYYDQNLDWREGLGWCRKAPDEEGFPPDEETIDEVPCRTVPGSQRCWAIFASDGAPALIAHDAAVTLVGPTGRRTLQLEEFYRDNGIDPKRIEDDELLTEIWLPDQQGWDSTYLKYAQRESFDFPSLGVAVAINQADDGRIDGVRIVLGAVSTRPLVVEEASELLEGEHPSESLFDEAGQLAKRKAQPMDNDDQHPAQRNRMAQVYTKRALEELTN